VRLLPRADVRPRVGQRPEATFERHDWLGPEPLHQGEAFVEHREPVREVDPECVELVLAIAGAGADDQLAAGEDVERGQLFGKGDRVVERDLDDRGRQRDRVIDLGRDPGERRDGLQPPYR
jgi:hypothetical protein